jgi:hypothetical protein
MNLPLVPLLVVLLAGGAWQKPKEPDFSGEWVLVEAVGSVSNPARALGVRQTITSTTSRGEPMKPYYSDVRIERQFDTGAVTESYKIGLISGTMSGTGTTSPQNERTVLAVKWQGDDLTIITGRYSGPPEQAGPYTEHQEIWSLDPNGRLSIRTTDESSGAAVARATLVYQRGPRSR